MVKAHWGAPLIETFEEKFVHGYDSDGKLEPFADLVEGKKKL